MKTHYRCPKLKKEIDSTFCNKLCKLHLKEGCSLNNEDYPIEETYFTIEVVDTGEKY